MRNPAGTTAVAPSQAFCAATFAAYFFHTFSVQPSQSVTILRVFTGGMAVMFSIITWRRVRESFVHPDGASALNRTVAVVFATPIGFLAGELVAPRGRPTLLAGLAFLLAFALAFYFFTDLIAMVRQFVRRGSPHDEAC